MAHTCTGVDIESCGRYFIVIVTTDEDSITQLEKVYESTTEPDFLLSSDTGTGSSFIDSSVTSYCSRSGLSMTCKTSAFNPKDFLYASTSNGDLNVLDLTYQPFMNVI